METSNQSQRRGPLGNSGIMTGIIVFFAGLALLGYKMGLPLPGWLFTWPMLLILIGFVIGVKDNFQNAGSWILILMGGLFLAEQVDIGFNLRKFVAPIILIFVGLMIILKPKRMQRRRRFDRFANPADNTRWQQAQTHDNTGHDNPEEEYVQINSIFGGVKRFIISKNFKGGSVVAFMGGAELNMLQADIQQPIILDINNVFGGTKIAVPSNWEVKNEISAVFGGVDDKRNPATLTPEPGKTLLLKGSCLFGGVEITNY